MNDKSNILAGLIGRPGSGFGRLVEQQGGNNKENSQQQVSTAAASRPNSVLSPRPQSTNSGRQHKLKQRFTVIRKLGKGTYGKVQLAINKETGQEVAIKTIKKTKIENEQDLQRVRREIQIMSSIEHPHIIHIYEVFENKDKIVLVMQYAPGGELYEYVSRSKALEESEARRLFRQVATAVYYCHENKICHRDLKLENILLDEKNNAKLADFGLSNVFDKRRHLLNTFCGSPLYASPEIVQGSPYEGPEVDCWSLGVLLYTLVYGAMPFDGSDFKLLVRKISEASYFEPKQKSQASNLIRRLLCADPAQRATISDICSDPWVNGTLSPMCRSPLEGSSSNSGQRNHSLLKVAQDMANLTPVRLDILLALAPASPPPRPPPPSLNAAQRASVAPEPMEDENEMQQLQSERATSPMASYVVREHEPQAPLAEMQPPDQSAASPKITLDQVIKEDPSIQLVTDSACEEIDSAFESKAADLDMVACSQDDQVQVAAPIETSDDKMDIDPSAKLEVAEDEALAELDQQVARDSVHEESQVSIAAEFESDVGTDRLEPPSETTADQETSYVEEPTDELIQAEPGEVAPDSRLTEQAEEEHVPEVAVEPEGGQEAEGGEKKKKKKKIIVVKKKKKKTVGDGATGGLASEKRDSIGDQNESSADQQAPKKTASKIGKTPGKVRIPNTFTEQQSDEPPPKATLEARRPSAMISDVSKKLLQQPQQPNSSPISPSEQVQLASVRVSEKKNDFERRASLMVEELPLRSSKPSSPQPSEQVARPSSVEAYEPKSIDTLLESIRMLADIEQTIVANVPSEATGLGPLVTNSPEPIALEPPAASVDRSQVIEDPPAAGSHAETEGQSAGKQSKRSTLTLKLGEGPQQVASETPTRPAGPAPIARSYKKVTFTKDGACITETGKIYAQTGEDGSVRRVERKSKVTHYPASSDEAPSMRHLSNSSQPEMRSFEKLIMPIGNELFDFGGDLLNGMRNKARSPRQPLGRTESNSSCSSGSTDVFDDIFDTWTGAVSMFHRPAFADDPISSFGGQWRRLQRPKRTPGSARCESTEPQSAGLSGGRRARRHAERTSGYDSDAATDGWHARPASALAGAVGRFGSSNLLNAPDLHQAPSLHEPIELDDFFNDHLFSAQPQKSLAHRHQELRRRLAKQHKQLWMGSNPTLFDSSLDEEQQPERQRPQARLWQFLRPEETERDVDHSDARGSRPQSEQASFGGLPRPPRTRVQHQVQLVSSSVSQNNDKDNQLNQSHSSSSFLRQSVALDASPRQRDTTGMQLPKSSAQTSTSLVQKSSSSASKASFITSKLADIQLRDSAPQTDAKRETFSSASFIQLKRTSSSSTWSVSKTQQQCEKSQQVQTCSSSTTSKLISTSDDSSSNFWDGRVSPMIMESSRQVGSTSRQQPSSPASHATLEAADSRVQSWLQESAGNLSLSSASQSSTSDTVNSGANPFGHNSSTTRLLLPPGSPQTNQSHSRTAERTLLITSSSTSVKKASAEGGQVAESSQTSRLVAKTASGSSVSAGNRQLTSTQTVVSRTSRSPVQVLEELALESEAQSAAYEAMKRGNSNIEAQSTASVSPTRISPQSRQMLQQESGHGSPTMSRPLVGATASFVQKELQCDRLLNHLDELDSLSGGELESRSSSSLLDQLRSRGYRSMINQRMGGQVTGSQQVQTSDLGAGSSNGSLVESSGRLVSMTTTTTTTTTTTSSGIQEESLESSQVSEELTHLPFPPGEIVSESRNGLDSSEQVAAEDLEEDEDVREAKANIKAHLDRVKETELFLKSMHQEEENMERQRQQLFLFNNLMLSSKLGLSRTSRSGSLAPGCSELTSPFSLSSSLTNHHEGLRSAPIQSGLNGCSPLSLQQPTRELPLMTNGFNPTGGSLALSFEPSYTPASLTDQRIPSTSSTGPLSGYTSLDFGCDLQTQAIQDPLEPVKPVESRHWMSNRVHTSPVDNRPDWMQSRGRSKSQLSELFADYSPYKRQASNQLSAGVECAPASQNVYFPSRRSVSQLRYTPSRLSQPALGGQMMSEYRSAYGASSPVRQAKSPVVDRSSGDDDDEMSAYRVSSYVPKVVPMGDSAPERPSRSYKRRSYSELDGQVSLRSPASKSLLQESISTTRTRSPSCVDGRRRSSLSQSSGVGEAPNSAPIQMEPNSRLSELEQRLQENKRRREELLFGSAAATSSPERQSRARRAESSEPAAGDKPELDAKLSKPTGKSVLSRPSRLESMEARIRRKSYCIRVDQDEQSERQSQLRAMNERWRPSLSRRPSGGSMSSGSPRGSISAASGDSTSVRAWRRDSRERAEVPPGSPRRTNGLADGESLETGGSKVEA